MADIPGATSGWYPRHARLISSERLEIARDVAWTKRVNHLPVRDLAREAAVMERTLRLAETSDLASA